MPSLECAASSATAVSIDVSTDLANLTACQVIISATNAPQPIINAQHIGHQPTILCDLAAPADVAPQLAACRPQAQVVRGGRFQLPLGQTWKIAGLDLGGGEMYACVVETVLLGLAGIRHHFSYGQLEASKVQDIQQLAQQYGFDLTIQFDGG